MLSNFFQIDITYLLTYMYVYSDISALTREVNNLSDELNELSEENEALRDQLGLEAGHKVDLSPLRLRKRNEMEAIKEEQKSLTNEVYTLINRQTTSIIKHAYVRTYK